MILAHVKFSLIDLETQKWATRGKRKQPERLSERTCDAGCDSLNSEYNKKKSEREIRSGFSRLTASNKLVEMLRVYNADAGEVRCGYYAQLACSAPGWNAQVTLSA